MRLCLENGCEPAERGEFTKRAFLNGKLSLTQAESVMDMISAQGEYTLRSARLTRGQAFQGYFRSKRQACKDTGRACGMGRLSGGGAAGNRRERS